MTEADTGKLPKVNFSQERVQSIEKRYELDIIGTVVLGGRAYWDLMRRGRKDRLGLAEGFFSNLRGDESRLEFIAKGVKYVGEGLRFAEWMERADAAVNSYVFNLYENTKSGRKIKQAMEDPVRSDHGFPHIRRDEEWFEAALLRDGEVRHGQLPFKFWLPAAHLAIRNHDVIQQLNGKKDFHPELAALFTLASYKQVAKAFGVDNRQAYVYCQFAAEMILNHSSEKAIKLADKESFIESISPQQIFTQLDMSFETLMPEVIKQEFATEFELLRQNTKPLNQAFEPNTDSQLVFKKYASLFAWADKADTLYPAKLTALRSLVVPDARHRPFYVTPSPLSGGMEMPLAEELKLMMSKDWWQGSYVARKIFELQRKFPLTGNSFMNKITQTNKLAAIREVSDLYTRLMAGDQEAIDEIFQERTNSVMAKVVSRTGPTPDKVINMQPDKIEAKFNKLKLKKYSGVLFDLETKKQELMNVIGDKMGVYSEAEINRVKGLFDLLYKQEMVRQSKSLDDNGEMPREWRPYKHFDSIGDLKDMRRNTLARKKRLR